MMQQEKKVFPCVSENKTLGIHMTVPSHTIHVALIFLKQGDMPVMAGYCALSLSCHVRKIFVQVDFFANKIRITRQLLLYLRFIIY